MGHKLCSGVVFLLLASVSCLAFQAPQSSIKVSPEEYSVYSAAIREMFAGDKVTFDGGGSNIRRHVVGDVTSTESSYKAESKGWGILRSESPLLTQELIDDFLLQNKTSADLEKKFDLKLETLLIKKSEIDEVRKVYDPSHWEDFYKKYPDSKGFIQLSRVGFNRTKDRALVYFQHWCGNLCGSGHYLLLSKGRDGWKVDFKRMIWIS